MEPAQADEMPPPYAPQQMADLLPIYRPNDNDAHLQTFTIRQTSPSTQTLTFGDDPSTPPIYHIKTYETGGFMNRRPHVMILREPKDKVAFAEVRFDIHGTGTTITYTDPPSAQRLELEDSRMQTLKTTIHGMDRWWQPFPGNRDVIELTNDDEEILARFVCSKKASPPGSPGPAKKKTPTVEIGQLHIVDPMIGGVEERVEILCSAITVVERAKRRRAILNNKSNPYGVVRSLSASNGSYIPQ